MKENSKLGGVLSTVGVLSGIFYAMKNNKGLHKLLYMQLVLVLVGYF